MKKKSNKLEFEIFSELSPEEVSGTGVAAADITYQMIPPPKKK